MSDPLQTNSDNPPPLFQKSTSTLAGEAAAPKVASFRGRILLRLAERPSSLWEVAEHFGVPDHVISGRFSELYRDGYIEHSGERRVKPDTDCQTEVWRIRRDDRGQVNLVDQLGYPPTLVIDGEPYDRQELLPRESYPGIPYARRADTGGVRLAVRVEIVECGGCGKPLACIEEGGQKKFRCGNRNCGLIWRAKQVGAPGEPKRLGMVMSEF